MFVIKELRFGTHYGNVPNPLQATRCPPFLDKLRLFRAIVIYSVSAYTVQFEFVVFFYRVACMPWHKPTHLNCNRN